MQAKVKEQRQYDDVTPDALGRYVVVQISDNESVSGKLVSFTYEARFTDNGKVLPFLNLTLDVAEELITVSPNPGDAFRLGVTDLVAMG